MLQVLEIAKSQVGYLEKKSNSQLDDFNANAGKSNYTKYARDYKDFAGVNYQGQAWCDMFVDWCFVQAYGAENAKKLIGGFSAYTPDSAHYYKNMGRYYKSNPQPGDQVFFKNSTRIHHTGLVYKVEGGRVYTYEGNTSNGNEVIPNGGAVCAKSYLLTNSKIDGYGRPDYSLVGETAQDNNLAPANPSENTSTEGVEFMRDLVRGDKNYGEIATLQRCLKSLGYYDGKVDHSFGAGTEQAVKAFQKAKGIQVNYPGTVGPKTWRVLLTEC